MRDTREAWEREGPGGEEAGFWLRADRVGQDNQALRQERDGLIERIKERIAGIYREASGAPGDMETTLAARDQWIELAKPTGDNRATRTRPRPQLALVYRIQQAPGHFMDNEDTRVPTVHIESGGPIIETTRSWNTGATPWPISTRLLTPGPPTRTPPQVPRLSDSASSGIPLWTMRTGCPYCP